MNAIQSTHIAEGIAWIALCRRRAEAAGLEASADAMQPGHAQDAVRWCANVARLRERVALDRWEAASQAELSAAAECWIDRRGVTCDD